MVNGYLSLIIFVAVISVLSWLIHQVSKDKKHLIDYYAFFSMGVVWCIIGIFSKDYVFTITGIIFTIFGLRHKGEWEEEHYHWKELNKEEQENIKRYLVLLFMVLLAVLSYYLLFVN